MILKFLKFIIVGFTGMVVDFSITILLKEKLRYTGILQIQPALFSLPALIICLTGFGLSKAIIQRSW
jgi:hypothetical protein